MPCRFCDDGDGGCAYPWYGAAPHVHDLSKTGCFVGSTVLTGKKPDNFLEDPECPGFGTYTHCLNCGDEDPHA